MPFTHLLTRTSAGTISVSDSASEWAVKMCSMLESLCAAAWIHVERYVLLVAQFFQTNRIDMCKDDCRIKAEMLATQMRPKYGEETEGGVGALLVALVLGVHGRQFRMKVKHFIETFCWLFAPDISASLVWVLLELLDLKAAAPLGKPMRVLLEDLVVQRAKEQCAPETDYASCTAALRCLLECGDAASRIQKTMLALDRISNTQRKNDVHIVRALDCAVHPEEPTKFKVLASTPRS